MQEINKDSLEDNSKLLKGIIKILKLNLR